ENRVVHHDQAVAAKGLRVGGDANRVDHIEVAIGTHRRRWSHRAHEHHRLVRLEHKVEEISRLFERICSMGDDDSVCLVLLEYRMDLSHQIEPIGINQCLAWKTTEGQLLHAGNAFELRELSKQLTVAQSLIRLDVPSKIQAIGAHRIDRPAGEDQSHSREQPSHRKTLRVAVFSYS